MKNSNKYRVSVYLGKELHAQMTQVADNLGIPLPTAIRIILTSGLHFEKAVKEASENDK